MAQPVHLSFGCVCCADMGIKVKQLAAQAQAELKARVSTDGMDQFFGGGRAGEKVVAEAEVVEVVEIVDQITITSSDSQYESLLKIVNEQAAKLDQQQAKLEAASFRIGYLEGQLENDGSPRKIRLLPDHKFVQPIWTRMVSAVRATFAWPPTPDELSDIK